MFPQRASALPLHGMSRGLDTHRGLEHDKGYGSDEKGQTDAGLAGWLAGWLGAGRAIQTSALVLGKIGVG